MVALLLANKAAINATDGTGKTPLHCAAEQGKLDVVQLLLGKSADVYAKDNQGRTPLDIAVSKGQQAVVDLLQAWMAPR
jgi:ankyrin repeat protein